LESAGGRKIINSYVLVGYRSLNSNLCSRNVSFQTTTKLSTLKMAALLLWSVQ
jgi:hypothetical protein